MNNLILDLAFILYGLIIFFSLYGTILFVSWWVKRGEASAVYAYVTMFLIGSTIEHSIAIYARYLLIVGRPAESDEFCLSWLWPARLVIWLLALIALVGHMSYRAFSQKGGKL